MRIQMTRRRWIGLSLIGVAGAGGLAALLAAPALGGGPFGHGHGHGFGRWGHHGRHALDEDRIRAHAEWLLRGVDGVTDAQLDQIVSIASSTARELHTARDRHGDHAAIVTALSAETVDRAALETLRVEHIAALDAGSRKLTEALARIAEVLTPAQRAQLAAQVEKLHALRGTEASEE
jgi:Spy/CpxP family protein refolding chaperone